MSARNGWTVDQVRALGTRTDLVTACEVLYGCGKNKSWQLYHKRELPFPALRVGRRVVVPVAPLLRLLELDLDMRMDEAPTSSTATNVPAHDDRIRDEQGSATTRGHATATRVGREHYGVRPRR